MNEKMKIALIFDCDGTLINSVDKVIESLHIALKKAHVPDHTSEEIHSLFGPGADEILKKLIGDDKKAEVAFNYFVESQKDFALDMKLYDGIPEMLKGFKEKHIPLGIVTGRHSRDLDIVLEAHRLKEFFDVIISDDQLKLPKPSPEGLRLVSDQLKMPCESFYYVGDAEGDIETAHKAGSKAIAALWDSRVKVEQMEKLKPEIKAYSPLELLSLF
jgi:pyrophosphatase PpaX